METILIQSQGAETKSAVPTLQIDTTTYVLWTVLKVLGEKNFWDPRKEKLESVVNGVTFVFSENSNFVSVAGHIYRLTEDPILLKNGNLWIPFGTLIKMLQVLGQFEIKWDANLNLLTYPESHQVIQFWEKEKKENGLLIRIKVPKGLVYSTAFYPPQFNINVFQGRVSEAALRYQAGQGVLRKITGFQFDQSAQISFKFKNDILKPEVVHDREKHELLVLIRDPGKKKFRNVRRTGLRTTQKASLPTVANKPESKGILPEHLEKSKNQSKIKTIIVDAGHGGEDSGARGNGVEEKNIVLPVSRAIAQFLKKNSDYKVISTTAKDEFISLKSRAALANKHKPAIFVSIHADAIGGSKRKRNQVSGFQVFFRDVAKNEAGRETEKRENAAIQFEKKTKGTKNVLELIFGEMDKNIYRNESATIAKKIEKKITRNIQKIKRKRSGVNQANFYVLRFVDMPSVLIELGFITNKRDSRVLSSKAFQKKYAKVISNAILGYVDEFNERLN